MCVGHGSDKGNDMFFLENQGNVFFFERAKNFWKRGGGNAVDYHGNSAMFL